MTADIVRRPLGPWPNVGGSVRVPVRDTRKDRIVLVRVSVADYSLAMRRVWTLDRDGYPRCAVWSDGDHKADIYLHRLVARAPAAMQVDHIRRDLLDCRRSQLRLATPSQNTANRRRPQLAHPSSSRFRGVTLHRQTGKWQAAAHFDGRCHYCGVYDREEDAAAAYDKKAHELWGAFAVLNNVPREEAQAA